MTPEERLAGLSFVPPGDDRPIAAIRYADAVRSIRNAESDVRAECQMTLDVAWKRWCEDPENDIARLEREAGRLFYGRWLRHDSAMAGPVSSYMQPCMDALKALDATYARQREVDGWDAVEADLRRTENMPHVSVTARVNGLLAVVRARCTLKDKP